METIYGDLIFGDDQWVYKTHQNPRVIEHEIQVYKTVSQYNLPTVLKWIDERMMDLEPDHDDDGDGDDEDGGDREPESEDDEDDADLETEKPLRKFLITERFYPEKDLTLSPEEQRTVQELVLYTIMDLHSRCGFVHGDLSLHNIFLQRLKEPIEILLCGKTFKTSVLPILFDFEHSYVQNEYNPFYKGQEWVKCILNDFDQYLSQADPELHKKFTTLIGDRKKMLVGSVEHYYDEEFTLEDLHALFN